MDKRADAFRTIGELAGELGIPQHILRYWETRFPQLRPLQRAGKRRYYRPEDVALARRIHRLLTVEGYTVKGVQKLLRTGAGATVGAEPGDRAEPVVAAEAMVTANPTGMAAPELLAELTALRDRLANALAATAGS